MNKYAKNVLIATWLGWLFDGMDSSLYPLVANQALGELIGKANPEFGLIASQVAAIFLLGWAFGGLLFGYFGDRLGRVKALSLSILTYALFTGLSGLAHTWQELALFRFLSGLGIGGEWALGVALLAESVKDNNERIMSTGFLATGFSFGYCLAIIVNFLISPFGWRFVFLFGIFPAILIFFIRRHIKEPEIWTHIGIKIKNPFEIFKKEYLSNLSIAFLLGVTFSLGSWTCVLFWLPLWLERSLGASLNEKTVVMLISLFSHVIGSYIAGLLLKTRSRKFILINAYFMCFITAFFMYSFVHKYGILVIILSAVLGFFFGIIPATFAIYFPELFPAKIRSTAKGFCYSTGRIVTAIGVLYSGHLVQKFNGQIGQAAALMSITFLIGAIVSIFAKETDKKLAI